MLILYQAEWGYVYAGRVIISAVNENGQYEVAELNVGDIWYFPKVFIDLNSLCEDCSLSRLTCDIGYTPYDPRPRR